MLAVVHFIKFNYALVLGGLVASNFAARRGILHALVALFVNLIPDIVCKTSQMSERAAYVHLFGCFLNHPHAPSAEHAIGVNYLFSCRV